MTEFETLTTQEVCEIFRISKRTVADWIKRGDIPPPIVSGSGRPRRWLKSDIKKMLDGEWKNTAA